jgi:hypothetical protein
MFVDEIDDWEPKDYINDLARVFRSTEIYKSKVRSYSHCITIEYAGERKLDVAPCVVNRSGILRFEVCNRNAGRFEITDPDAYTDWVNQRNLWAKGNHLKKGVRLLKYLRDIKGTFTCPSILLTTLIGNQIYQLDEYGDHFCDTPTALRTIMVRLDDWLQAQAAVPIVANPVLAGFENFASTWSDATYENFRDVIHRYRGWIDDAFMEEDRNTSISKWRRVFSEDFAKGVEIKEASSILEKSSRALIAEGIAVPGGIRDVVDLIAHFGTRAIPKAIAKLPYLVEPIWPVARTSTVTVRIRGKLHFDKLSQHLRDVGLTPLPKGHWIRLEAVNNVGMPFSSDFTTKWRVANTGDEAVRAQCLRGGIELSETPGVRWEQLSYRGVHLVEAFVIRNRDGTQVGKSDPFYVVIE